jgi:putative FmdB family regulatory protein
MPYYDYDCRFCGPFDLRRPINEANEPARCPNCEAIARRLVSAPFLAVMNPHTRIAHARNEKSAHEPQVMGRAQLDQAGRPRGHSHAHHHGSPLRKGLGEGWVKSGRSWMIGH